MTIIKAEYFTDPERGSLDPPTRRETRVIAGFAGLVFVAWLTSEWLGPDPGMRFLCAGLALGGISTGILWSTCAWLRRQVGSTPTSSTIALLLMAHLGAFGPPLVGLGTLVLERLARADGLGPTAGLVASLCLALLMVVAPAADLAWHHWHVLSLRRRASTQATSGAAAKLAQLEYMAFHDSLTGLANRPHFQRELGAALQSGTVCAVMMIDLDKFKRINDLHGHAAGDEFLITVAQRLRGSVRADDLPARLGGDEFAVLLRGPVDHDACVRVAERILAAMTEPFVLSSASVRSGGSVGIALSATDSMATDVLTEAADKAMYEAKQAGGGRYVFAAQAVQSRALERTA